MSQIRCDEPEMRQLHFMSAAATPTSVNAANDALLNFDKVDQRHLSTFGVLYQIIIFRFLQIFLNSFGIHQKRFITYRPLEGFVWRIPRHSALLNSNVRRRLTHFWGTRREVETCRDHGLNPEELYGTDPTAWDEDAPSSSAPKGHALRTP